MKKHAKWVKFIQILVTIVPLIVVLFINAPVLTQSVGKGLSLAAIVVIIICLFVFKDAMKKYFQMPSAFKISLTLFIISFIAINLGQQLFLISLVGVISSACAMPLGMLYEYLTRPASTDDVVKALQDVVKEKSSDEKSDKES